MRQGVPVRRFFTNRNCDTLKHAEKRRIFIGRQRVARGFDTLSRSSVPNPVCNGLLINFALRNSGIARPNGFR